MDTISTGYYPWHLMLGQAGLWIMGLAGIPPLIRTVKADATMSDCIPPLSSILDDVIQGIIQQLFSQIFKRQFCLGHDYITVIKYI